MDSENESPIQLGFWNFCCATIWKFDTSVMSTTTLYCDTLLPIRAVPSDFTSGNQEVLLISNKFAWGGSRLGYQFANIQPGFNPLAQEDVCNLVLDEAKRMAFVGAPLVSDPGRA
jgi:hypothetical protein